MIIRTLSNILIILMGPASTIWLAVKTKWETKKGTGYFIKRERWEMPGIVILSECEQE
jgi:hypothetical protein